jgi:hypothetical protein
MDDKRDVERVPILGDLRGEMMVFQPIQVRDISRTGATVETRYPLHLNSLHDVRLTLGPRSVIVKGRVVHSHISDVDQDVVTYKTGLEFLEVPDRIAAAIDEYLETLKSNRSGV